MGAYIIIGMRCISKLKAFQQHLIFKWAKITPSIHPSTSLHRKTCFGHHYPSQQSVCAIIGGALRCPTPHLEDRKKKNKKKNIYISLQLNDPVWRSSMEYQCRKLRN